MFEQGLVDEVVALLDRGLRDGVTASRALGYAQVLADLDAGGDGDAAREPTFIGTPPLRATAAIVVSPRSPDPLAGRDRCRQRRRRVAGLAVNFFGYALVQS